MIKLVEYKYHLRRGTILRCKGQWPYETVVDFMVAEVIGEYRYQLWVVSGYKAGLTNVIFPPEATYETCAVNTNWLIDNWNRLNPDTNCGELNEEVVMERRKALEWLICKDKNWDSISLDT